MVLGQQLVDIFAEDLFFAGVRESLPPQRVLHPLQFMLKIFNVPLGGFGETHGR
jgi:hypothetical protein